MLEALLPYAPFVCVTLGIAAALWSAYWLLIKRHPDLGKERRFPRQLVMLGMVLVALVAMVLVLPISESSRNHLLGLVGIAISAVIALSSTTVVANLMAGVLLRITKPFRIGDFIRAGEHSGRVTERGLFDTEIQSESRELIAIPNTFLISHPVTTVRSSGTVISVSLSLGFDVHHGRVEPLLMKAAEASGLADPFVHILDIGNYSVTYRVSGFLEDTKRLLTARSNLCRQVLDVLHGQAIEIMSPSFMTQRRIDSGAKVIPPVYKARSTDDQASAEDLVFDKAEQAERLENEKQRVMEAIGGLEASLKDAPAEERNAIKEKIEGARKRLAALDNGDAGQEPKPGT